MANFSTIWFHHVFTTRNRERVIAEELDQALHDHLGSVMKSDGAVLLAAGGASDHLHTLVGCRPTVPACDIARRLKSKSSLWLKKRCRAWPGWQPGYACFSVSAGQLRGVTGYLSRQRERHRQLGVSEELEDFEARLRRELELVQGLERLAALSRPLHHHDGHSAGPAPVRLDGASSGPKIGAEIQRAPWRSAAGAGSRPSRRDPEQR